MEFIRWPYSCGMYWVALPLWDVSGGLTLVGCIGCPYPCEICQVALPLWDVLGGLTLVERIRWPYFCVALFLYEVLCGLIFA